MGSKREQGSITGKKHRKGEQEPEDGKVLSYALLLSRAPSSSTAAFFTRIFKPAGDLNATEGWRVRKAVPEGPPMKWWTSFSQRKETKHSVMVSQQIKHQQAHL